MTSNYTNTYRNILLLVDEEEEKTRNKHNTHSSQGAREPGSVIFSNGFCTSTSRRIWAIQYTHCNQTKFPRSVHTDCTAIRGFVHNPFFVNVKSHRKKTRRQKIVDQDFRLWYPFENVLQHAFWLILSRSLPTA